jgi:hypothetical protein
MYAALRTSGALHKKSTFIGPVLCRILQANFAEFPFYEVR